MLQKIADDIVQLDHIQFQKRNDERFVFWICVYKSYLVFVSCLYDYVSKLE